MPPTGDCPTHNSILAAIRANPKIPAPPQIVFRVLEATKDPDVDIAKLAGIISRDAGLTGQLLRQANSALYGFATPTSSVADACMRLGLKRVRTAIVNQHVVSGLNSARPPGFEPERYWQSAFAASVASQDLAKQLLPAMAEDASTAGLLCDVGIGLMAYSLPEKYEPALSRWLQRTTVGLHTVEAELMGTTHAEIGADILVDWKLDAHLIEAVRMHHVDPATAFEGEHARFAHVVAAAVLVAQIATDGSDMSWVEQLFAHLDPLTDKADAVVARLLDELVTHIQDTATAFAVELGPMDAMAANFDAFTASLPDVSERMSTRPMANAKT